MIITDEQRRIIATALHMYGSGFLDHATFAAMKDARRANGRPYGPDDSAELAKHGKRILEMKEIFDHDGPMAVEPRDKSED